MLSLNFSFEIEPYQGSFAPGLNRSRSVIGHRFLGGAPVVNELYSFYILRDRVFHRVYRRC